MAFPDKGITPYGFVRPNLTEIIENIRTDFKDIFGSEIVTSEDSVTGHFISIFAGRENEYWKLLEALYTSQTLSGAEGVFLNDMLSKVGVVRAGQTYGTGYALLEFDENTSNAQVIPTSGTTISSATGSIYTMDSDVVVSGSVGALRILRSELQVAMYIFTIVDVNTSATFALNLTLSGLTDPDITAFYTAIENFIATHTTDDNLPLMYEEATDGDFLVGFDLDGLVVGISGATEMRFDAPIARLFTKVFVTNTQIGYIPLEAGQVTDISPEPSGFLNIYSPEDFFAGSEVETDAEYRYRFDSEPLGSAKATRDAVTNAIFDLDGTSAVKIYVNTTDNPATSPADPNTFLAVVYGGVSSEIAKAIYDTMPIDAATSGTFSLPVDTADGEVEVINYSPANLIEYVTRVTYSTANNIALSTTEQQAIKDLGTDLAYSFNIGDTVYHDQVLGAVLGALAFGRVTNLDTELKEISEPDSSFTVADKPSLYNELPTIKFEDTVFVQVLI